MCIVLQKLQNLMNVNLFRVRTVVTVQICWLPTHATALTATVERIARLVCILIPHEVIHELEPEILCVVLQILMNVSPIRVRTVVTVQICWLPTHATALTATVERIARLVCILIPHEVIHELEPEILCVVLQILMNVSPIRV